MDKLPTQILVKIFEHLTPDDLISLTFTCTTFNDLISRHSTLLDKLELKFHMPRLNDDDFVPTRKYTKVSVNTDFFTEFLPKLLPFAENFKTVFLSTFRIFRAATAESEILSGVRSFLQQATNVKNLIIGFQGQMTTEQPKLHLNLTHLKLHSDDSFLAMFSECQVQQLEYTTQDHTKVSEFTKFLQNQRDLVDLTVGHADLNPSMYRGLSTVQFRLKKLQIGIVPPEHNENLIAFLELHRNSLKHFKFALLDVKVLRVLSSFEKLKSLAIHRMISGDFPDVKMEQIEKLSVKNFREVSAAKFPNLKHIELLGSDDCSGVGRLVKLRSVSLKGHCKMELNIPQVKKMSFMCLNWNHEKPFTFESHQLDELYIHASEGDKEWIEEFESGGFADRLKVFSVCYN
jgi:hypothetical protein